MKFATPLVTSGELARVCYVTIDWINMHADEGSIDCERRAYGRRYFHPISAPKQVKKIWESQK